MLPESMILPPMTVNPYLSPAPSPWRNGRKARRDRALKREAVIRAAARAFNERGYHNTSLDDIAAALKVTKPTIYYYVENKEQLLFECFCAGLAPVRAAFQDTSQDASQDGGQYMRERERPARERLRQGLLRYAQAIASDFGWCMVRAEDQDLSPQMRAHVKSLKSEIDQAIRRLLRAGAADGSIGACDPKMTAFALAGALNWIAHWYRDRQAQSPEQIAEAFVTLFENGLRPRAD